MSLEPVIIQPGTIIDENGKAVPATDWDEKSNYEKCMIVDAMNGHIITKEEHNKALENQQIYAKEIVKKNQEQLEC